MTLPYWDFSPCDKLPQMFSGIDEMRVDDAILKTVMFIGGLTPTGAFVPGGTAFLVTLPIEKDSNIGFPYVVTAKHVLTGLQEAGRPIAVRLNRKERTAVVAQIKTTWYFHPHIPDLDIAVAPLQVSRDLFSVIHIEDKNFVSDALIKELDIGCGDEVYTMGLLVRRLGEAENIPIVRIGNISAMAGEPVDLGENHGRHSAYLIESRSIGGLSGSPVFWHTPNWRVLKKNLQPLKGYPDAYLLGVNIGLLQAWAHADRLPGERLQERADFLEAMSSGIAVVLPAQRILEILDTPELKEGREIGMANHRNRNTGFKPTAAEEVVEDPSMEGVTEVEPDNPTHKEDFTSLLNAAARKRPQDGQT